MLSSGAQTPKSGNCILLANEPLPLGLPSLSESFFGEQDISMFEASLCSLHLGVATELLPLSQQRPVLEKSREQAQDTGAFKAAAEGGTAYSKASREASVAQGSRALGQPLGRQSLEVAQHAIGTSRCVSYQCT